MISQNSKKKLKSAKNRISRKNNTQKCNQIFLNFTRYFLYIFNTKVLSIIFFSFLFTFLFFILDLNISLADNSENIEESVLEVATDDIYKIAETNGIATAICKAIQMSTVLMVPLFAVMFTILGFKSFQGEMKWGSIATFVIGIAAFKGAGNILEMFLPNMGLQYGCDCAIERSVRDINGQVKRYATGVNKDCSEGTTDYELEFGEPTL